MSSRRVYGPDHEAFRQSVARFLAAEAVPHYDDWDAKGAIPAAFWDSAREYGFVGLAEADDPRFAAAAVEEAMAAGLPAVALAMTVHDSFALPLLAGHQAPRMAAVVEGLQAEERAGGWVVSGGAPTVLNGMGADVLAVLARTDGGSSRLFAVAGDAAGLRRSPAEPLLGLDALDVADLHFEAVPAQLCDAVVESARTGYRLALAIAAMAGARAALTITVDYVKQRKAFGRPIAEFENTRVVLAGLGARVAAVGSFVDTCLADGPTPQTAAAAQLCATQLLADVVDQGVQLHGGYGYMWEYPISRAYAAAPFFRLHAADGLTAPLASALDL